MSEIKCSIKNCDGEAKNMGYMIKIGQLVIGVNLCDKHLYELTTELGGRIIEAQCCGDGKFEITG